MLFKNKGKPQEGDYVICTVDNIVNNSVFVKMDEYNGLKGMIHISEISPGRIRNIRDFVTEGKKIIAMILRVKRDRNQYDISLRRVQLNKKRRKQEEIKQEQRAEKILEITVKALDLDLRKTYQELFSNVEKEYSFLHELFNEVALSDESKLSSFVKDKKLHDLLLENIISRIKPEEFEIKRVAKILSFESDGASIIRNTFEKIKKETEKEDVKTNYLGSGKYTFIIKADSFEDAEEVYSGIKDIITKELGEHAQVSFEAPKKGTKA